MKLDSEKLMHILHELCNDVNEADGQPISVRVCIANTEDVNGKEVEIQIMATNEDYDLVHCGSRKYHCIEI